ncbi:MAG TPA: flagellar basal body protein [Acidimicrobiia bacterium]|nr:flagellar basal body protein [Acidimicrobiia bacterium]
MDLAMEAIQGALHGLAARQRAISDNVANTETPGFLAEQVSFEDSLRDAIQNGGDPGTVQPTITRSNAPTNLQGNNVSLDDETVSMMQTGMQYQLMVEAMTAKFNILRMSIGKG